MRPEPSQRLVFPLAILLAVLAAWTVFPAAPAQMSKPALRAAAVQVPGSLQHAPLPLQEAFREDGGKFALRRALQSLREPRPGETAFGGASGNPPEQHAGQWLLPSSLSGGPASETRRQADHAAAAEAPRFRPRAPPA